MAHGHVGCDDDFVHDEQRRDALVRASPVVDAATSSLSGPNPDRWRTLHELRIVRKTARVVGSYRSIPTLAFLAFLIWPRRPVPVQRNLKELT